MSLAWGKKKKTASISFSLANIHKHPHTHTHTIVFSFAFSIWIAKGHREGKGIKKKHKRSHHCLETLSTTKKKKSTAGCSSTKLSCESAHTAHSQTKPYSMLLFLFPSSSLCGLSCSFLQRGYIHTYIYTQSSFFSSSTETKIKKKWKWGTEADCFYMLRTDKRVPSKKKKKQPVKQKWGKRRRGGNDNT